ncbi:MAG: metallophosphoesterase [Anaerolineales bacterium]
MRTLLPKKHLLLAGLFLVVLLIGALPFLYPDKKPGESDETPPIYSSDTDILFAVIGDFGNSSQPEEDVANLVNSWQPDFIVTTGDNNYTHGSELTIDNNIGHYYADYIGSFDGDSSQNRFFPTSGNHDWASILCIFEDCRGPYLGYFSLPGDKLYYDFVWGPVHFFVLDSNPGEPDGTSPDSVQGLWLKNRLTASTSAWNIVVAHHPPYSSGKRGSTDFMQWPYKDWGADIVLTGHDHIYERLVVDDFPYIVNGLGGKSLYSFGATVDGSQVRYNQDFGAMLFEATPQDLSFDFITRTGEMIDHFELHQ